MNPVGWFEIYIDNIARAKSFYEALFQLTLEPLGDPTDDTITMLAFPSDYENYGASEEARVVDAGGKVERSKMSIGEYGFITLVTDSEGNSIGLHSQQ
jgi:predicted enzyme related to lactoylglutathione lyase